MTDEEILQREAEEEDKRPHDDYCWAMSDDRVRAEFGGRVVAVNKRQVWGSGANASEALADAQPKPGCPHRMALIFVSVPLGDSDSFPQEFFQKPVGQWHGLENAPHEQPA